MLAWAVGSLVTATFVNIQNFFYLRFLTDSILLPAGVAALVLILPKFLDVVSYPAVGVISDRTTSRFGRRRPFMVLGMCLLAASLVAMFSVSKDLPLWLKSACVLLALMSGSTAIAIFNVPFLAMPAEMTDVAKERNALISYRVYCLALGQFIVSGLAPVLMDAFGGGASGHLGMAWVMAGFILLVGGLCVAATRRARATRMSSRARAEYWKALPQIFRNRNYLALLLCKFTFLAGVAAHTATASYYVRYVMEAPNATLATFLLTYSVGMIASQPVWTYAVNRAGKVRTFVVAAMGYAAISLAWMLMLPGAAHVWFMALSVANGIWAGGLVLSSQAMLPDAIDEDYAVSGVRREASLSSFFVLAEKASYAAGLALVALTFEGLGYQPPDPGRPISASSLQAVVAAFGGAPALLLILSALSLRLRRPVRLAHGPATPAAS